MKILQPAILFLFFAINLSAQTYFQDDFEGDTIVANNLWTSQVVTASASNFDWILDEFGGNQYVEMNNYNGSGNEIVESWLFTPSLDLSGSAKPILNFDNLKRFSGTDMQVLVSSDFEGTNLPVSTWMDITAMCNLDTDVDSWDYGNSGDVDLTAYKAENFTLAFRYQGGDSDGSIYQIDNISIVEGGSVSVKETSSQIFSVYPNPASSYFMVDIDGMHEIVISDVLGNVIKSLPMYGNEPVSTKDLNSGIYFVQIGNSVNKIFVK